MSLPSVIPFRNAADRERHIGRVVAHLRTGGLIAYPTETVYGFGSLLLPESLERLRTLKGRPEDKPFLLLIRDPDVIAGLRWNELARRLAAEFWPGPLTLAIPAADDLPATVRSQEGTVAVRASPHPGAKRLTEALGAITSTSANRPGEPAASSAVEVAATLGGLGVEDVWILDGGELPASDPSTIVDCSTTPPRIIRAGAVDLEAIRRVAPEVVHDG